MPLWQLVQQSLYGHCLHVWCWSLQSRRQVIRREDGNKVRRPKTKWNHSWSPLRDRRKPRLVLVASILRGVVCLLLVMRLKTHIGPGVRAEERWSRGKRSFIGLAPASHRNMSRQTNDCKSYNMAVVSPLLSKSPIRISLVYSNKKQRKVDIFQSSHISIFFLVLLH